jgi:hypothetical protein
MQKSQHIGDGASEIVLTVCGAARESNGGWNTNCARILVDAPSEGEATKVT